MIKGFGRSLRLKWIAFCVLLCSFVIGLLGFGLVRTYQEDLKTSLIGAESERARFVVERTRAFFEKVEGGLLVLAHESACEGTELSRMKKHFQSFLAVYEDVVGIVFLNDKGLEIARFSKLGSEGLRETKDYSGTELFRTASRGRIYRGDFGMTKNAIPTMVVAVPVWSGPGKLMGVLAAHIHLQSVWDAVKSVRIGEKGFAYMVDHKGSPVYYPDTERALNQTNVRHFPIVNEIVAAREGHIGYEHHRGEGSLFVFQPIRELGWAVVIQVPAEEVFRPLEKVRRRALVWVSLSIVATIALGLVFTKRIIRPIRQLSNEMTKVSRGNLNARIEARRTDELGLLARSFNEMVENLRRSQEALAETEKRYRRIFENSRDMIYMTSVDGRFIEVNQAGVEMLGYASKSELMNTRIKETYFCPEDRKRFQDEINKKGFVKDFEVRLKRRDGTPIDCLITANIRKEEEGVIAGYEGIIKDISFIKLAEKELVQRTEQLQTLYELGTLINQSLDIEKVLPLALYKALGTAGFDMGTIHLVSESGQSLELKSHSGFPPALIEQVRVLGWGEGVAGSAVEMKRPVIVPIEDYPTARILPFLKEEGVKLTVGVPLISKGKAIGAITLSTRGELMLGSREIHLLENLGAQIGLAVENARLFSHVAKAKSEWETTFDAVTDLLIIRDKEYRIIRANKTAFQRYGLRPGEMIGRRCFEIFHQRCEPCEGCYVSETLRTGKPVSGERECLYLKGIFLCHTFPIFNEEGIVVGVVDLAREVTEEKKKGIEKEVLHHINQILASSLDVREVIERIHEELKKVLRSDWMTIALLENDGDRFRYLTPEAVDQDQQGLGSKTYGIHGTLVEKAARTGHPVFLSDTTVGGPWVDQEWLPEGTRSCLLFPLEVQGRVIGTLNFGSREASLFSEDHIPFLKQIAVGLAIAIQNALLLDEIKASEERYRTVVESAMDGICVIGEDGRFSYVNGRFSEILGYSREELIGMDYRNCLNEEGRQFFSDRNSRRERGERVPRFLEFNVLRKDGEIRNVECSARAVRGSDRKVNFVVIIKDVTEKKKMEERMFQWEKLRALGEMASGVAHDFNNALTAILGNVQLLLHTAPDEDLKETLRTIEKVAKDGAQTVRRLQEFTRKGVTQECLAADVNTVIRDSVEITKPKWRDDCQGRGVQIEVALDLAEVPPVVGNVSELREVITNLIFNAVEAMPEGGTMEIRTYSKEGRVYIRISDTGIGMTEEVRRKVFEPFFTTKPFTNTGLGLSMSYGIIKRFGGEIEVESQAGRGTTFTIILPVCSEGKEELRPQSLAAAGDRARILVIDDDESVRSVLSRMLSQVDHQVTVAKGGGEGLKLFQEGSFDIVLTDMGMPDMSGWDVCRAIKKMRPRVTVGMITGWGMELDPAEKEASGLDFVVSKPFDFHQLLRTVDQMIKSRKESLVPSPAGSPSPPF